MSRIQHQKYFLFFLLTIIMVTISISYSLPTRSEQLATNLLTKFASIDTYVLEENPDESYSTVTRIRVGYDSARPFGIEKSLLRFEIPVQELPSDSNIESAQLSLFLASRTENDQPMNIMVSQVANNWQEDVTWNDVQDLIIEPNFTSSTLVDTSFVSYEWDLTALVKQWAGNQTREQELSLILQTNLNSGQHERTFWANECECGELRPKLTINFTAPTPTVAPRATATPTATPAPTPTPEPIPEITVFLRQSTPAPIGQNKEILYTIEYANNDIAALANVLISNKLPEGAEFVAITKGNGQRIDDIVVWTIGSLAQSQGDTVGLQCTKNYR